ncbi:MAG: response regulator, partial [Pseudomonadota bacterium]|nr:response regulator [Pseudomonadota bacterium]
MEAVRALETLPYDLAFLDISMPEMDGREALAEVLSRQRRNRLARQINRPDIPPLPIIALTANVMSGDRESYLADGFTAVISKPFEERELLEAILNFAPAPEDRDPLAPLDAQSDEAHGIDLIVLDQLAERLGDGFTQTSVEI